jgi:hypothetical protein
MSKEPAMSSWRSSPSRDADRLRLMPVMCVHRDNRRCAQKNTFDAVLAGAAAEGVSPEIDMRALRIAWCCTPTRTCSARPAWTGASGTSPSRSPAALSSSHTSTDRHNLTLTIPEPKQIVDVMFDDNAINVGINFDIKTKDAVSATVAALTITVKISVSI